MIEAKATISTRAINRREFLYYLLGASAATLTAGACGAAMWLTLPKPPKPRSSEEDGLFTFLQVQLPSPSPDIAPMFVPTGRFWLSNTQQGLLALQPFCTARGCLFKWNPNGSFTHPFPHFVCPCCGSHFTKSGVYIEGVAPRNLDQFTIEVTTPNGIRRTPADGGPVDIQGATQLVVDVQKRILGKPPTPAHSLPVLINR